MSALLSLPNTFAPDCANGLRSSIDARERQALRFLMSLSADYPNIESWYLKKVLPDLRDNTRKMIVIERHGRIVAIGIGKDSCSEKKICTVRVSPEYAGKGLGIRIFGDLMDWMGCQRPHLTVSQPKLALFERIFEHYGYCQTSAHLGLYVPKRVECFFNEPS